MARNQDRSRAAHSQHRQNAYAYVDGTVVRKLQTMPKEHQKKTPSTSLATKQNRSRALRMNTGYVLFLTVAAVVTVFVCVNYLQLQAQNTKLGKEVTALEVSLDKAVLENDADYNRIMNGIDMEHVKDVAMNELGMDYARKGQIVTYSRQDSDYVRQYREVPEE